MHDDCNAGAGRNTAYVSLSRGWVLGSKDFKENLLKDHTPQASSRAWEVAGKAEIQRLRWAQALSACLHVLGKTPTDATADPKSAPWKVATAAWLKQTTQAQNRWLAEQLAMGSAVAVSHYVSSLARSTNPAKKYLTTLTTKLKT